MFVVWFIFWCAKILGEVIGWTIGLPFMLIKRRREKQKMEQQEKERELQRLERERERKRKNEERAHQQKERDRVYAKKMGLDSWFENEYNETLDGEKIIWTED